MVYEPHEDAGAAGAPPLRTLNFNKTITALAAGPVDPGRTARQSIELRDGDAEAARASGRDPDAVRDVLMVGLSSALMVYDVDMNADVFYRECPDGVHALCYGLLAGVSMPLVVVGGNCSVMGFGREGTEEFWTVTGDASPRGNGLRGAVSFLCRSRVCS